MKRVDVLYLIEHVARELDIACALKYLVGARSGLQVHIASLVYDLEETLAAYQPRLLVAPYFYSKNDLGIRRLSMRKWGAPCLNLAFEQLVSPVNARFKRPSDPVARQHVVHAATGEFFADYLESCGVAPQCVERIGSLAMGLNLEPYREFFRQDRCHVARRHGLDPRKAWVFFPENYFAAFFTTREIERRVSLGCDPREILQYRDFAMASFRQVMSWCRDAEQFGDVELIVRPRPATSRESFVRLFRQYAGDPPANVHFIKEGTIRLWNLICDAVVTSYSTSAVEAALVPKPVFLLTPEPIPACLRTSWNDVAPRIANILEFRNLLSDVRAAPLPDALTQWARDTLLSYGDPLENATTLIAEICQGNKPVPLLPRPPHHEQLRYRIDRFWEKSKETIRGRSSRSSATRTAQHENDVICQDDVSRRTSRWAEVLSRAPNSRRSDGRDAA